MTDTPVLLDEPAGPDSESADESAEVLPEIGKPIRRDPPSLRGRAGTYTYTEMLAPLVDAEEYPYETFYWIQRYDSPNGAANIVSNLNRGKSPLPDLPDGWHWLFRSSRCKNAQGDYTDKSDLFARVSQHERVPKVGRPTVLPSHGPIPPGSSHTASVTVPHQPAEAVLPDKAGEHYRDVVTAPHVLNQENQDRVADLLNGQSGQPVTIIEPTVLTGEPVSVPVPESDESVMVPVGIESEDLPF